MPLKELVERSITKPLLGPDAPSLLRNTFARVGSTELSIETTHSEGQLSLQEVEDEACRVYMKAGLGPYAEIAQLRKHLRYIGSGLAPLRGDEVEIDGVVVVAKGLQLNVLQYVFLVPAGVLAHVRGEPSEELEKREQGRCGIFAKDGSVGWQRLWGEKNGLGITDVSVSGEELGRFEIKSKCLFWKMSSEEERKKIEGRGEKPVVRLSAIVLMSRVAREEGYGTI